MKVKAPWDSGQVLALEKWQKSGNFHPFTCVCGETLIPTINGWTCLECEYIQDWAHDFMFQCQVTKGKDYDK